jgi:adenosine kinase
MAGAGRALICGSLAYDTIMVFRDRFANHILPDQVHILNVSFTVPELRREWGGCAANIAYNLKLLGGEPVPMATVGEDFEPYRRRLEGLGIDTAHLVTVPGTYTAQAYITTDLDDNQITAFHPGAMAHAERNSVGDAPDIAIGIVAPDWGGAMLAHCRQFAEEGIPFVFDPGQGLPLFDRAELLEMIEQATWVAVNDYEEKLLVERTGLAPEAIAQRVEALIVTRGEHGSVMHAGGHRIEIPAVQARAVRDPTGCGDAYRAGLLHGLLAEYEWPTVGRIASLMGALKVEHAGTQNHRFTPDEFQDRFEAEFGYLP